MDVSVNGKKGSKDINWALTDIRFNAETDREPGPGLDKCRPKLYWL